MHPRRMPGRFEVLVLLGLALSASSALAEPISFTHPAAARDDRAPARALHGRRTTTAAANSADGAWHEFDLLQISRALATYDAAHDQFQSIGGSREENWALPLGGPLAWQPLPANSSEIYLDFTTATQDPATGLIYFQGPVFPFEIDVLDPQTGVVTAIPAAPGPSLAYPSLVYDGATHRLIVFAESYPSEAREVWALDLSSTPTWTQLAPTGTPPPVAYSSQAVLDPVRHRMLFPSVQPELLWALTLDDPPQWQQFPTTGLAGFIQNPVVYDAASDLLWTIDQNGMPYSLDLATHAWSLLVAGGTGPTPRVIAGVAIDPVRHRLLVNGGVTPSGDDTHSDVLALSLDASPAWTELVHDGFRPPIRGGASDGYDSSRHRMVVFGGSNEIGYFRNDTWVLDFGPKPTWSPLTTSGTLPPPRYWHSSAWDESHDRLVVYGGYGPVPNAFGDLWTLSFSGGTPTWSQVIPDGNAPPARFLTQFVYDSARDRFLLFYGCDNFHVMQDVWELRLSPTPAWRQLAPGGTPPSARAAPMCAYDRANDRVLFFGGSTNAGYFGDLWALNLGSGDGAWQPLGVQSGPSGRNLGLLRMDTSRNRLVLFGGYGVARVEPGLIYIEYLNDTWALDLSAVPTWRQLSPAGPPPSGRDRTNGAYDPVYDRLVLGCGYVNGLNDLWTLNFGDTPTPTLIDLAFRDVRFDRVRLVWAGADPGTRVTAYRREVGADWLAIASISADGIGRVTLEDRDVKPGARFEYRLGVITAHGEAFFGVTRVDIPGRALALSARVVDGRASFTVELASGEPATLAVFDVVGRQVWSRELGALGPGSHDVSGAPALESGLYFARLIQHQAARFARLAVVR